MEWLLIADLTDFLGECPPSGGSGCGRRPASQLTSHFRESWAQTLFSVCHPFPGFRRLKTMESRWLPSRSWPCLVHEKDGPVSPGVTVGQAPSSCFPGYVHSVAQRRSEPHPGVCVQWGGSGLLVAFHRWSCLIRSLVPEPETPGHVPPSGPRLCSPVNKSSRLSFIHALLHINSLKTSVVRWLGIEELALN